MRIRKPHKVAPSHEYGVSPPYQALITCTYQKLFKKDAFVEPLASHGSGEIGWIQGATGVPSGGTVKRKRRHELGMPNGREEVKDSPKQPCDDVDNNDVHGSPGDDGVHETLVPRRRKVKSSRYMDYIDKITAETSSGAKRIKIAVKRPRNNVKDNSTEDTADIVNTVASSKEALISSIFYVFDTLGKSGLTASEVVGVMLEQNLPGLKEGGARHTVQVANVLRRSPHFVSIGNKRYLPCSVLEERNGAKNQSGLQINGSVKHSRRVHVHISKGKENTECKLYDGSGWRCTQQAELGYSLCIHHLDIIKRPSTKEPHSASTDKNMDESFHSQRESQEYDSDLEESEEGTPPLTKSGRDRNPGIPMQKRKMLSLMSIK